jgi:hypothetical protein
VPARWQRGGGSRRGGGSKPVGAGGGAGGGGGGKGTRRVNGATGACGGAHCWRASTWASAHARTQSGSAHGWNRAISRSSLAWLAAESLLRSSVAIAPGSKQQMQRQQQRRRAAEPLLCAAATGANRPRHSRENSAAGFLFCFFYLSLDGTQIGPSSAPDWPAGRIEATVK